MPLTTMLDKVVPTFGMLDCGKLTVTTGMPALAALPLAILTSTCNAPLTCTSGVATPGSYGPLALLVVLAVLIKNIS